MKKNKRESLILGEIFKKIAPEIGASVLIEPEWGIVGQITFSSGKKTYFKYNTVDLNPIGASDIARDKDFSNFFMSKMGYPIIPNSKTFYSKDWAKAICAEGRSIDDAFLYAKNIGFPVIVKPNCGSQGSAVTLVYTKSDFYKAMHKVFRQDRVAVVQSYIKGRDYRLVVLDEKIISAYERISMSVVGDGELSIQQLINVKQLVFERLKRDTQIKIDDFRIAMKLKRQKLTFASVLKKGEKIFLLDNANLSTGGDSIDITNQVHPKFKELAVRLTKDMGLRFCGVDLMIQGDICETPNQFWVLEVNAAPGLDHYARSGEEQQQIVEDLYLSVLKSLDK
ncbi:MAG: hypothetical protein RLZZ230_440 [Candidatus Parcubacteria bacterium]|jgi:D-alanine-D-alanine ligase-like ATP-grasp enzyme